jgi:hypothetical protein
MDTSAEWMTRLTWALAAAGASIVLAAWIVVRKNRAFTTGEVFYASRWTRGNRLFPTQAAVTPTKEIREMAVQPCAKCGKKVGPVHSRCKRCTNCCSCLKEAK